MSRVEAMRARLAENCPTLPGSVFDFICDEEVCYFEVRVYDGDEKLEVRRKQDRPSRMYEGVRYCTYTPPRCFHGEHHHTP